MTEEISSIADRLRRCSGQRDVAEGKKIHQHIDTSSSLHGNRFLSNLLVQMYGKCGCLHEATAVFNSLPKPNVYSWNSLLKAYIDNALLQDAREVFERMGERDLVTWNEMLTGYARAGHLQEAKQLFDEMPERNVISWTPLLDALSRHGRLAEVEKLFEAIPEPNIISWNALMSAYAENGESQMAWRAFRSAPMRSVVSWNVMISACFLCKEIRTAVTLFDSMPERDVFSWNAMVSGYARNGEMQAARKAFDRTPEKDAVSWSAILMGYTANGRLEEAREMLDLNPAPDAVPWSLMISAYAHKGEIHEARQLFDTIPWTSIAISNTMLSGYTHNGNVDEALELFEAMEDRDLISWNTVLAGYAQNGYGRQALVFFARMDLEGMEPDAYTFVSVLDACGYIGAVAEGRMIHGEVTARGYERHVRVVTALLNLYGKSGMIPEACSVFTSAPVQRDLIMWNAMINILGVEAERQEEAAPFTVFELFRTLNQEGFFPDDLTFLGILSACSHAGLVEDGCGWFTAVSQDYHQLHTTGQYVAMVDLLGRAGWLEEARYLMSRMEAGGAERTELAVACRTLVATCSFHGDDWRARDAFEWLEKLETDSSSSYILLSNTYKAKHI